MKIVIDTNVVVSALFFGGKPQRLLHNAISGVFEVVVSKEIIEEYIELIERISDKYSGRKENFSLNEFISICRLVAPTRKIGVCRDRDDNKFLECAAEAKCLYVVSGDNDLLALERFEDIEIITVTEFFDRFF